MNGVYWRTDERGFTLFEMLLVLSLLLIILAFFPSFMNVLLKGSSSNHSTVRDVTIFFNHLSRDIREGEMISMANDSITITKGSGDQFKIERVAASNEVRRLRNGSGHVLLLEQVQTFQCSEKGQLVYCEVEFTSGDTYQRIMPYYYVPIYPEKNDEEEGE